MVSAPPLDILKRSVENGQKNKLKKNNIGNTNQNIGNYRNSRYWLCLYKLKLLLFQYYGDVFPRFITGNKILICFILVLKSNHVYCLNCYIHVHVFLVLIYILFFWLFICFHAF